MLIEIDEKRCIGCGRCVSDCVGVNLRVADGVARVIGRCIMCGHCVAICPTEAVSIPSYDMAEVEPYVPPAALLDASALLKAIKARRSIRDYRADKVERDKIDLVLQAGRYTATAKNTQGCRFIVVQDELARFKGMLWDGIDALLALPSHDRPRWVEPYESLGETRRAKPPVDYLFRNAPAVVFIAAERADDAGLAAQNMELMAASLGLGMLFNGYLCRAALCTPGTKEWLEAEDKPLQLCMLMGYPALTYLRTAPRRAGDFVRK